VRPLTTQIGNEVRVFREVSVNRDHHAVFSMQAFASSGEYNVPVVANPFVSTFAHNRIQIACFGVKSVNVEERERGYFIA
jgi:hypothetical protein